MLAPGRKQTCTTDVNVLLFRLQVTEQRKTPFSLCFSEHWKVGKRTVYLKGQPLIYSLFHSLLNYWKKVFQQLSAHISNSNLFKPCGVNSPHSRFLGCTLTNCTVRPDPCRLWQMTNAHHTYPCWHVDAESMHWPFKGTVLTFWKIFCS